MNMNKTHYSYEETPIHCGNCSTRLFALAKCSNPIGNIKIVQFLCPVCDKELHYALLTLTNQING